MMKFPEPWISSYWTGTPSGGWDQITEEEALEALAALEEED